MGRERATWRRRLERASERGEREREREAEAVAGWKTGAGVTGRIAIYIVICVSRTEREAVVFRNNNKKRNYTTIILLSLIYI